MTLNLEMEYEGTLDFDYEELAKKVMEAALDYEGCPYETEINLVLTGNEEIQQTNRDFRDTRICLFNCSQHAASDGLRPYGA